MAKAKRPAEFPTDWHFEAHIEALKREIQGRKDRLAWFKSMDDDNPDRAPGMKQTQMELDAAEEQLAHYTKTKKSSRPKAKAETR